MSAPATGFMARVRRSLKDGTRRKTLDGATRLLSQRRRDAAQAEPGFEAWRARARQAKFRALADLPAALEQFERKVTDQGGKVHWARDSAEAREVALNILKDAGVKHVVKSKSMATEEIELNAALESAGIRSVETDLGEYVAQLSGQKPSHIILPIIHMARQEVGKLFRKKVDPDSGDEVGGLVADARRILREDFRKAGAGITGANFAVADEGAIAIVSNEGNARFVTSLPRVHVALVGIDKIVPSLSDLPDFLNILARSATGQKLTVYSNLIWPGRQAQDGAGAAESHVILLDNGRSGLLAGRSAEMLACIRCGACLNVCPIYRAAGGHAYGGTYPGPMGSILSPALGDRGGVDLAQASTLCGACREACPVGIDIPALLLRLRSSGRRGARKGLRWRLALKAYAAIASRPWLYRRLRPLAMALAPRGKGGWSGGSRLAPGWSMHRQLKSPSRQSFAEQWAQRP